MPLTVYPQCPPAGQNVQDPGAEWGAQPQIPEPGAQSEGNYGVQRQDEINKQQTCIVPLPDVQVGEVGRTCDMASSVLLLRRQTEEGPVIQVVMSW